MIFYRSNSQTGPRRMNVLRVRVLSIVVLAGYIAGTLLVLSGGQADAPAVKLGGYGLIALALFAFAGMVGTGVQRIAGEEAKMLDPLELEMRQKAYARSFHVSGVVLALAAFYLQIAGDLSDRMPLWVPSTSDHWSAVMWGILLLHFVVPTLILSWNLPVEEVEE